MDKEWFWKSDPIKLTNTTCERLKPFLRDQTERLDSEDEVDPFDAFQVRCVDSLAMLAYTLPSYEEEWILAGRAAKRLKRNVDVRRDATCLFVLPFLNLLKAHPFLCA